MSSSDVNLENYLIPLEEIERVTENFSPQRYIGRGGFGKVYRGQLSERWGNRIVAIKRLDRDSYQGEHEFRNELKIISSFHHENIISFVGYCDQGNEMIIVYEYASKGSLDQHLQDQNKMSCITWIQRLQICIGTARGLNYLHSGLEKNISVIHRDVKSANILLDENLIPKVCDFGLSKSGSKNQSNTQLFTKVAGTQFYVDPSYHESGILRRESDVYSFGVVLFEILSGVLVHCESMIGGERHILMNSVRRYHKKDPQTLIDPSIRDQIDMGCFDTFKEIAYQCIRLDSYERPMLDTVIEKLEEALIIQIHRSSSVTRGTAVGAQSFNTFLTSLPMLKESFKKCFKKCCSQIVEEERGTWSDLLIQVICDEWIKCKREIEASSPLEEPGSILFPTKKSSSSDMIPDESSFAVGEIMYERVKAFVVLHHLQVFSASRSLPDQPPILPPADFPENSRAKSAGLNLIGPILGTELNLVDAVDCKISFERGKQRQFSFLAISMGTSGWIILAEELPENPQYGTVRVFAPLVGCKPKIEGRHSRWLHLRIRPSTLPLTETAKNATDLKLESKPLTDGSWTLAFRDEASCKSALTMILEEIDLQCNEVERRLTPLISPEEI